MNSRTLFWSIAFLLPVALAIALLIPLRREHAALLASVGQWKALVLKHETSLANVAQQRTHLADQKKAMAAIVKRLGTGLSPWQRWNLDVLNEAMRLSAEAGSKPQAGHGSLPPIVQFSDARPYFRELLGDPAYAKAVSALMKQQAEVAFGRMLASLNLSAADQDKLEDLLVQREMAPADAAGLLGTTLGTGPVARPTLRAISQEIQATFGPQVAQQYRVANKTETISAGMDDLADRLSYTSTPLAAAQADQLYGMLSQANPSPYGGMTHWQVPDEVISQAQGILAAPQLEALVQIQEEQQAGLENRKVREARLQEQ
jgi:hypothetical protein